MQLIFKYIFKYKRLFLLNILSFIVTIACELYVPHIIGEIIAKPERDMNKIIVTLCFVVVFIFLGNLTMIFSISKVSSLIFKDLSFEVFKKINTFSTSEIQEIGIANIVSRSIYNINQIINFITSFYKTVFCTPIVLMICFYFIYNVNPSMSYGIIFTVFFLILFLIFIIKKNFFLSLKQYSELEQINYKIRSDLMGMKVIRSLNKEKVEEKNFEKTNSRYANSTIKLFNSVLSVEPIFYLFLNASIILTTFIGAQLVFDGGPMSDLYIAINYNMHIIFNVLSFLLLFMLVPKTMISIKKINLLLNMKPYIENNFDEKLKLEKIKTIEFKNVSFQSRNTLDPILKNINFQLKESEIIAIVGRTGSGKTTLMDLIPRLIDPTEGNIEINGIDIKNYDFKVLRDKIGFVSQKNILFKGTILSNLLFGKENANEEEILEQTKISQSYEFIQSKEKKLQAPISELGNNLSGGQKQRISITRAFLKQPDVYIFDDSFSALDYKTDLAIRRSFFSNNKNSIIIIVAQRLTSILDADKIIVLDKGEIVDIGKHKELMKNSPLYQSIAFSQNITEKVL
ncbi:ABC transporter ATP-binding protein ['Camptotheca acuminata' phytoplasma]|uniref:ABC transporter ATP-binding protein n=1 Tax='Camptotheca acuminata' phytoplasma TaxID=3239192 RepID=UPI00351AA01F